MEKSEQEIIEDSLKLEKAVIEKLAAIEHEQWIKWSQDIASKETLSVTRLSRWKNLWIPYLELSEEMKEHDRKWAREALKVLNNGYCEVYRITLQKGKELERNRQLLEGHEACNLAVVDKIEITEKQASKIADLQKENKELLETLQSVLCQACESRGATDTEPPEYDSMALSAYADGLRLLSKYKRFRIHDETGRRVIGYMR